MRVECKKYYYFEKSDKEIFIKSLKEKGKNTTDFAKECNLSPTLISLIINGNRPITKNLINKLKKYGIKVEKL